MPPRSSPARRALLTQAQQRVEEAQAAEQSASRKLLAKDVEIGGLKGEVSTLRTQMINKADQLHQQYKTRILDLEVQVGGRAGGGQGRWVLDPRVRVICPRLHAPHSCVPH